MKGFIEISLLLILSVLSPMLRDINQELQIKINLLSKSKITLNQLQQAESDLNYFIANDNSFDYKSEFTTNKLSYSGTDFTVERLETNQLVSKTIALTKQRLFNWERATKEISNSQDCTIDSLDLNDSKLFNCKVLNIRHLLISSSSKLVCTGEIKIEQIEFSNELISSEIIAYLDLKIKDIQIPTQNKQSLLIFSQIADCIIENPLPPCEQLAWEISSKYRQEQCFSQIKTGNYWPLMRIISSKASTQLP